MNKKTIVLADNSYTIRRIVELSFSEEEEIELVSFEDGQNLKEKLLELKPEIVMVDIKLPEFNGYEICKFINETDSLAHTKVFLMKGGFEPIDENLLARLKYIDIITKPFDSNALVATIKKILAGKAQETPSSMPEDIPAATPEDLPEMEGVPAAKKEISFSDVQEEIDLDQQRAQYPEEEVLPSEEITQGAIYEKDALSPDSVEEIENPFKDEPSFMQETPDTMPDEETRMKENIEIQEKELEIDSLTQEEMALKRQIEEREKLAEQVVPPPISPQAEESPETAELFPEEGKLEEKDQQIPEGKEEEEELPEVKIEEEGIESPLELEDVPAEKDLGIGFEQEVRASPDTMPAEAPPAAERPDVEAVMDHEEIDFEKEMAVDSEIMEPPPVPEAKPEDVFHAETQREIEVDIKPEPPQEPKEPEMAQPPEQEMPAVEKPPAAAKVEAPPAGEPAAIPKDELIGKVEDRLTNDIKEMLWEILPSMAERIIREEIDKLRSEVEKTIQ